MVLALIALVLFAGVAAILGLLLYFYLVQHHISVERVRVVVESMNARKSPLVVAHLSDFHCDFGIEDRMDAILTETLQALKEVRPDAICLTGDYVNCHPGPIDRLCRKFVSKLPTLCSMGVYASLGNHDSYGSREDVPSSFKSSSDYIASELENAGAVVLRNHSVEVDDGVWICGLEDVWNPPGWRGHRIAMQDIHRRSESKLRIVLSHNPDTGDQLKEYDYDLQLSGHVHGGQVCFPPFVTIRGYSTNMNVPVLGFCRPLFDWLIPRVPLVGPILGDMRRHHKYSYVVKRWEWAQGLHDISNGVTRKQLYVTKGVGTHRNMRLFCPPELSILLIGGPSEDIELASVYFFILQAILVEMMNSYRIKYLHIATLDIYSIGKMRWRADISRGFKLQ